MPLRIPVTAQSDSVHSFEVQVHVCTQVNCVDVLDVLTFFVSDTVVLGWLAASFLSCHCLVLEASYTAVQKFELSEVFFCFFNKINTSAVMH